MTLRKDAINHLSPYDQETITAVVPDYYTKTRPSLDRACSEIAKLRGAKDIARPDILDRVNEYNSILNQLIKEVQQLATFIPTLEEVKKKKASVESKGCWKEILLIAVGAVLLALAEWIFAQFK